MEQLKFKDMKIELNIGLENNPLTPTDITQILWLNGLYHIKSRIHTGEYLGNPERTLVIESKYIRDKKQLIRVIKAICLMLTQECIAVTINGDGSLIYDPTFKGEKIEFNKEYFINY